MTKATGNTRADREQNLPVRHREKFLLWEMQSAPAGVSLSSLPAQAGHHLADAEVPCSSCKTWSDFSAFLSFPCTFFLLSPHRWKQCMSCVESRGKNERLESIHSIHRAIMTKASFMDFLKSFAHTFRAYKWIWYFYYMFVFYLFFYFILYETFSNSNVFFELKYCIF